MEKVFKYGKGDKWSKTMTTTILVALAVGMSLLFYFYGVVYITMWMCVVATIIISLFVLSVPRKLILGEDNLEIRCVLETTYLPLDKISSVKSCSLLSGMICVWGSFGFFGYYGYYVNFRGLTGGDYLLTRVYARNRSELVEIICEGQRYLIGCSRREELIDELRKFIPNTVSIQNNK